eukprot:scaffold11370_cov129-Isochrysis_galbana.AAC.7
MEPCVRVIATSLESCTAAREAVAPLLPAAAGGPPPPVSSWAPGTAPATARVFCSRLDADGTLSVIRYLRRKLSPPRPAARLPPPLAASPLPGAAGCCSAAVRREK